jgi:maltooligosyltrehalose synthase
LLSPPEAWGDTVVILPESLTGRRFRDIVTGAAFAPEEGALPVALLLRDFPVACGVSETAPDR